jgi:hypothetical protein
MDYAPFHERFPEIAGRETRSVTIFGHPVLPAGEYGLLEFFCNRPGCDCQRVMFYIVTPWHHKPLAVIAYGWESKDFYARWYGRDDADIIAEMLGPTLNRASVQSELAPGLLALVRELLLDEQYVARIKRHYRLFKKAVDEQERRSKPVGNGPGPKS